jgi:predicted N-formylglutamate amidohydrolase
MGYAGETSTEAVRVTNRAGQSPFVILCDHASNFVPDEFRSLGLNPQELARHIAWDPGALPVAQQLAEALDAALVEARISRLVIDCNRPVDAPDLIAEISETTPVPGNRNLSPAERARRMALAYEPYHAAIDDVVTARVHDGRDTRLVAIHSFNPVYKGTVRPWHIGVVHDEDERLARPLIARLARMADVHLGINQPYSPADRVYFTLERHAWRRNLPRVMIEIRNDQIIEREGQRLWAERLAGIFTDLESEAERQTAGAAINHPVQRVN